MRHSRRTLREDRVPRYRRDLDEDSTSRRRYLREGGSNSDKKLDSAFKSLEKSFKELEKAVDSIDNSIDDSTDLETLDAKWTNFNKKFYNIGSLIGELQNDRWEKFPTRHIR